MANSLCYQYREVYWPIRINLEAIGVNVKTVNSSNKWIRDYFPLQINGKLFRFQYRQDKKYPHLSVSNTPWNGVLAPVNVLPYFVDGGNIVHCGNKIIMTEKVTSDNYTYVVEKLKELLECEIIIIPVEPGDTLGHSDGIVKFIDKDNVLINDYSSVAKRDKRLYAYQAAVEGILDDYNLTVHRIPNAYDKWNWSMSETEFRQLYPTGDDYNPGYGYYLNFLRVKDTIFLPAMKIEQDREAYDCVKKHFPECSIVMVDCSRLSMEGGLVHCVTAGPYED